MAGSPAWQEQDNCFRCCKLTLDGGGYFCKQLLLQETVNNGSFTDLGAFFAAKKKTIFSLKARKTINDTQYLLMFPKNGSPTNLEHWDITLVTVILTSCLTLNKTQKNAIKDVRELRNNVHGHTVHLTMTESTFQTTWADISSTLTRISALLTDTQCQTVIVDMIASVEHEALSSNKVVETLREWYRSDRQVEEMIVGLGEKMGGLEEKIGSLGEKMGGLGMKMGGLKEKMGELKEELKTEVTSVRRVLEDTKGDVQTMKHLQQKINTSIENQQYQTIDQRKLKRKIAETKSILANHMRDLGELHMGHKTRLTQIAANLLLDKHVLVLQGKPGVGKSHIAKNVLKELSDSVPDLTTLVFCDPTVNEVEEVIDISNKYLLMFDDFLGRINIDTTKVSEWNRYINTLISYTNSDKVFLVITIRKNIKTKCANESVDNIFSSIWNLDLDVSTMNDDEKRIMFKSYAEHLDVDISNLDIDKVINKTIYGVGFPVLCRVMKGQNVLDFFTKPVEVIKKDILCMPEKDTASFVCLIMTLFCDDTFKISRLSKNETQCIEKIKKYFGGIILDQYELEKAAQSMSQTYLKIKDVTCYAFVHDTILEATFMAAKIIMPEILIQFCPINTLVTFSESFLVDPKTATTGALQYQLLLERFKETVLSVKSTTDIKCIAGSSLWKHTDFIKNAVRVISPEVYYQEDDTGKSLVVYFAGCGCLEIIEEIEKKIDEAPSLININKRKEQTNTAMHRACLCGKGEIVKYFISYKIEITTVSMYFAVKGKNVEVLEMLLNAGGNIRARNPRNGGNLLHLACRYSDIAMAKCILRRCERYEKLELLAAETIDKQQRPIHFAASDSTFDMLKLLVNAGSDVTCKDINQFDCLNHVLINHRYNDTDLTPFSERLKSVRYLIKQGIDPEETHINGVNILHFALACRRFKVVQYLCDNHYSLVHKKDNLNNTSLHIAAIGGSCECVDYIIDIGLDITATNSSGSTVLHVASYNGRLEVVNYLCEKYTSLTLMKDNCNRTAGHEAAEAGHLECLKCLIGKGVNPLATTSAGETVLHTASQCGQLNVVKFICNTYLSLIHRETNNGTTAAHKAAEAGHLECLVCLIEQNAVRVTANLTCVTVLHTASHKGQLEVVEYLCNNHTSLIKTKDKNGFTAAHYAAVSGHLECLKYLIGKGVNPMATSSAGETVLHTASQCGQLNVVKFICKTYPSLIDRETNNRATAAHEAAEAGHLECLKYLIRKGVNPMATTFGGETVLHTASQYGKLNVVKFICNTYPSLIDRETNDGATAAHEAAEAGHLECLVCLIEQNADRVTANLTCVTVLHTASHNGQLEVVEYLCNNHTSLITTKDMDGFTAAHYAAVSGHLECLKCLIGKGVNPMATSSAGETVLHTASQCGQLNVVKFICKTYPSLIDRDTNNRATAAHEAAEAGHLECLKYLIRKGVNPMATTFGGETVLHTASQCGQLNVVKFICNTYPSLIHRETNDGATAAHEAADDGHLECLKYLTGIGKE